MHFPEYASYDGLGLAELVRTRQISPQELCEAAILRIERANPRLGAVVTPAFERARAMAAAPLPEGPFFGVPFLLKDLGTPWAGVRLTSGSRLLANHVSTVDGVLVERYRKAGLVFLGRTATPEFGLVPFTESRLFGPTHTPWKLGHIAGGSSGGSAAAVASGMVPMAHGGDGGGSLRIPASCCGVFGFKPTRGRTPIGPLVSEEWHGFAIEHALTRSVRDSAALLDATAGPEPGAIFLSPPASGSYLAACTTDPRPLRVAFTATPHLPGKLHPDCQAALDDAVALVTSLGHTVEEVELDIDAHGFARDFFMHVATGLVAEIDSASDAATRTPSARDFEPSTWVVNLIGRQFSARDLMQARHRLHALVRAIARRFESFDVLLTPTLAMPPPPIGALRPRGFEDFMQRLIWRFGLGLLLRLPGVVDASVAKVFEFMPYPPLANVTGQPSMSVPLYWNADGLPIGTMFTGRFGDEATLFALAAQLERARPWANRRPPAHADALTGS